MNPTSFFEFGSGVGPISGLTLPGLSSTTANSTAIEDSGHTTSPGFLGEPFAVWLGFILILVLLKFLTQQPGIKILGENVNPAYIRIGGYNWLTIGVSAATFIIILKVIANRWPLPGITPFANAL